MPRPQSPTAEREVSSRTRTGAVAIIPARLQSTRLPEKALQDLGGAPLVVRVLERVRQCSVLDGAWVATDSDRIVQVVEAAGGKAIRTRGDHVSGLDRVAEAAGIVAGAVDADPEAVIVNVQGDEPFVSPEGLTRMIALFERSEVRMGTIAAPFPPNEDPLDPSRV